MPGPLPAVPEPISWGLLVSFGLALVWGSPLNRWWSNPSGWAIRIWGVVVFSLGIAWFLSAMWCCTSPTICAGC